MTLLGYFWDRWPSLASKLSLDITTTSRVAKSSTSFGWGKGGKVTTAGWQVILCDPIWHVISHSGEVISITNCYIWFTLLYFANCRPAVLSNVILKPLFSLGLTGNSYIVLPTSSNCLYLFTAGYFCVSRQTINYINMNYCYILISYIPILLIIRIALEI